MATELMNNLEAAAWVAGLNGRYQGSQRSVGPSAAKRLSTKMVRADRMTEFFENSEIFITGGSGVVGKAIIEKLLRSCNVRRIYVLLRPKRQMTADQRLRKMQQARIFQVLNVEKPNEMDKLTAIPGDVALPSLGIDEEHMQMLQRVSIIYHCAATVRFDEPIRVALRLNVGGTLEALKIAETLQHLRIFVHISTFFSNPYLKRVEPKVSLSRIKPLQPFTLRTLCSTTPPPWTGDFVCVWSTRCPTIICWIRSPASS